MKSSDEIEKALYESSNSSISITKKDGKYFNVNQFKDIEKIKEVDVKKQVDTNTNKQYFKTDIVYKDGKRYKFEIKTEATNEYKASDIVIIYYPD